MSYTIEYQRRIFIEQPDEPGAEPVYYVFVEAGDNNVYDWNGRRSRSWCVMAIGSYAEVIERVCDHAGGTEGGSLRFAHAHPSPESYLAFYRKQLKTPLPFADLLKKLPVRQAYIILPSEKTIQEQPNPDRDAMIEEVRRLFKEDDRWYEHERYSLRLNTTDDFKTWLRLRRCGYMAGIH